MRRCDGIGLAARLTTGHWHCSTALRLTPATNHCLFAASTAFSRYQLPPSTARNHAAAVLWVGQGSTARPSQLIISSFFWRSVTDDRLHDVHRRHGVASTRSLSWHGLTSQRDSEVVSPSGDSKQSYRKTLSSFCSCDWHHHKFAQFWLQYLDKQQQPPDLPLNLLQVEPPCFPSLADGVGEVAFICCCSTDFGVCASVRRRNPTSHTWGQARHERRRTHKKAWSG